MKTVQFVSSGSVVIFSFSFRSMIRLIECLCETEWKFLQEIGGILCSASPCSLIAYTEQYVEYDPLITPAEPSNPWISDDTTLWDMEKR